VPVSAIAVSIPYLRRKTSSNVVQALTGVSRQISIRKVLNIVTRGVLPSLATRSVLRLRRAVLKVLPVVRNCPNKNKVIALVDFGKRKFLRAPKIVHFRRLRATCCNIRQGFGAKWSIFFQELKRHAAAL
jgi:hypothetical protein